MRRSIEQFSQENEPEEGQVKVTRVPDYKSVYIEQIGTVGRSVILNEFKVAGKTYRAGYSSQSDTVFVSQASRD